MSDCAARFEELTREATAVLEEDLAALSRRSERARIERYNDLKASEEAFTREFREECPDFLTPAERDRVRGDFRLARLLVAASFYAEGPDAVPRAMTDDFVEAELRAVVDFDRYKRFDALSESQIEERIRRMDGEVYELVTEYTSTQLANVDELVENPDVQRDVIERLLDRYEERREKIRRGFFTYVETHGLEHMVEAIEDAVTAVNEASAEREAVREDLHAEREAAAEAGERLRDRTRDLKSRLVALEGDLASGDADPDRIGAELDALAAELAGGGAESSDLEAHIERTAELDRRLAATAEDLEAAKEAAREEATESAREEATRLVEDELAELHAERERIEDERAGLERERERIESAREAIEDKRAALEERVADVERSLDTGDGAQGVEGGNAVTAATARVLELDYLGRFDISMAEARTIETREGPFEVPDGYWEGRSSRTNEWPRLASLVEADRPEGYPINEAARYEVTASRYLGLSSETELVIEARVVADLEAFATNGFDADPADLDQFLGAVNDAVGTAEAGGHDYLLGLASPTGWSERVREQVADEGLSRSRYSKYLGVCLVDLQDGSLVYDETDAFVAGNADLFAPPIEADRVADCVETVRREYVDDVAHESVLLRDATDEHGFDEPVVKRAFNRLEEDGAGEQLYLDEMGLSLQCGT